MPDRTGLIVTASVTILVAIVTNLGVIPIQWSNFFVVNQFTTGTQSNYAWTLLNSTILEFGSDVSGNATFQGFQFQTSSSSATPILYVLSPSQFTTWVSTTPLNEPKSYTQLRHAIIDLQNNMLSFKFTFVASDGGIYRFLMTDTSYFPTLNNGGALTYSATTITPPFWYRITALMVPVIAGLVRTLGNYQIVRVSEKKKRSPVRKGS